MKDQMDKLYTEINHKIIEALKAYGYKYIQIDLLLTSDMQRATVEFIPSVSSDSNASYESLNSSVISEYAEGSHRVKYVIDQSFLDKIQYKV